MAAKKDFSGINTGRVYAGLEQATSHKGQQPAISQQEAEERAAEMRTQGRAGARMPRINMAFSSDNYRFIKIMSTIRGESMTTFLNYLVTKYREEHPEIYTQAKAIIDSMG